MLNLLDIWIIEGSGWVIDKIIGLYINVLCAVMLDLLIFKIKMQKE